MPVDFWTPWMRPAKPKPKVGRPKKHRAAGRAGRKARKQHRR